MRNESYPVAHVYLYEPVVDLFKLSKAAGLLIFDASTPLREQQMLMLSSQTESADINLRPASGSEQRFHRSLLKKK